MTDLPAQDVIREAQGLLDAAITAAESGLEKLAAQLIDAAIRKLQDRP